MFAAKRHPLLVPHDGSFDIRKARTSPGKPKDDWKELLGDEVQLLGESQYRLYADGRHAVLLVFQALDAAGKDSTIRHVFAGVNPCGLHVASFKEPSKQELAHDFLWRTTTASARARQCGDLQPQLLRGGARRPRAPRATRRAEATGEAVEDVLGRPPARDCRLRAASRGAGHRDPEILVQHVEGRAAQAVARAHRGPREAVEIQRARPRRARAPHEVSRTLTSSACVRRRGRGRRGMPCRQTTSTTCVGRSRSSSTRRCNSSASISRAPTRKCARC